MRAEEGRRKTVCKRWREEEEGNVGSEEGEEGALLLLNTKAGKEEEGALQQSLFLSLSHSHKNWTLENILYCTV